MNDAIEIDRLALLEQRIAALESDNWNLKYELSSCFSLLNCLDSGNDYPTRLYWNSEADDDGAFCWQPFKVLPNKERDYLIRLWHSEGLPIDLIRARLFSRGHKNSRYGVWSETVIKRVIKGISDEKT